MKKFLQNIVKLKEISTIKDFRFGTFPSISGSGSGYTLYRPPESSPLIIATCSDVPHTHRKILQMEETASLASSPLVW